MVPTSENPHARIDRVQIGVRMERSLVKVLKALAEFEDLTLGQLLEKIVLHSFESAPGEEGELSASPHSKRALEAIAGFQRIYEMDLNGRELRQPEHGDDV